MAEYQNILYIFFTHKLNLNKVYDRIINMMKNHNSYDFVIVQGGFENNSYNKDKKMKQKGKNANYIPDLKRDNPNIYAISVCNIKG